MIIDAVIPLLIEHGKAVTSKQIAESAGIAEGTVYRAFGDKDSLIAAAVAKYMDPKPLRDSIASLDPTLSLEFKVHAMVSMLRAHFAKVFRMTAVLEGYRPPPGPVDRSGFTAIIVRVLGDDIPRLNCSPQRVAQVIRLMTFSASVPQLNDESMLTDEEIAEIVLNGVAGVPNPVGVTPPSLGSSKPTQLSPTTH
jgi:AcrR family transcriptional regulator